MRQFNIVVRHRQPCQFFFEIQVSHYQIFNKTFKMCHYVRKHLEQLTHNKRLQHHLQFA